MAIKIISATYSGLEGQLIEVEVDITRGMPYFAIVGLPDAAIKEAKERVKSAILNSGYDFPLGRIIVNLAPADVKKIGSLLDLPIALGILASSNQINPKNIDEYVFIGELSLSGEIKGVRGTLPIVMEGINKGREKFVIPLSNIEECNCLGEGKYFSYGSLKECALALNKENISPYKKSEIKEKIVEEGFLYEEILGQQGSKRAMEIVAAGGHNIFLFGSTGVGKTMLAKALPSILPRLTKEEEIEVAKVSSITGNSYSREKIRRPFRSPHHSITKGGMIGGGAQVKAGEITLAHKGILFLDEILEFKRDVIENLREPLEEGFIKINKMHQNYFLPSDFILVGSFNICPCGKKSYESNNFSECKCTDYQRVKYISRMSKAIADRVDLYNYVPRVSYGDIKEGKKEYSSCEMKKRVEKAVGIQRERYKNTNYKCNGDLKGKDVFKYCKVSEEVETLLKNYFNERNLSMRAYGKLLKVSRTIADLNNNKIIEMDNVLEAINYRKDYSGEVV